MLVILLSGCEDKPPIIDPPDIIPEKTQKDVYFNLDNQIVLSGNNLYFRYKELECNAKWILKPSESGLLEKEDINIGDNIKFNKGLLTELECNKELECNDIYCKADNYKIILDPEILEDDGLYTEMETYIGNSLNKNIVVSKEESLGRYHKRVYFEAEGKQAQVIMEIK